MTVISPPPAPCVIPVCYFFKQKIIRFTAVKPGIMHLLEEEVLHRRRRRIFLANEV